MHVFIYTCYIFLLLWTFLETFSSFGVLFNYSFCNSQHPSTSQVINTNNLMSHLPYFSLCLRLISKYVCESITVRSSTKNTIFHTTVSSKSTAVHTSPITIISTVKISVLLSLYFPQHGIIYIFLPLDSLTWTLDLKHSLLSQPI